MVNILIFLLLLLFISLLLYPCNKGKSIGRGDKTLLQRSRMEPQPPFHFPVSFRISCKCTGFLSRLFSAQVVKVKMQMKKAE